MGNEHKNSIADVFCFYEDEPANGSCFIAVYSDLSGASLFCRFDNGDYSSTDADLIPPDGDWFADAGYLWFIYMPHYFFEKVVNGD